MTASYAREHLAETARIAAELDAAVIDRMAVLLAALRARGGRLFFSAWEAAPATRRMQ